MYNKKLYGLYGEYLAIIFLFTKGYKIIKHNYKHPLGEIDIIARKKQLIIFIEVKARHKIDLLNFALSETQKNRITSSASNFINNSRYKNYNLRFDIINIWGWFNVNHYKNCW